MNKYYTSDFKIRFSNFYKKVIDITCMHNLKENGHLALPDISVALKDDEMTPVVQSNWSNIRCINKTELTKFFQHCYDDYSKTRYEKGEEIDIADAYNALDNIDCIFKELQELVEKALNKLLNDKINEVDKELMYKQERLKRIQLELLEAEKAAKEAEDDSEEVKTLGTKNINSFLKNLNK